MKKEQTQTTEQGVVSAAAKKVAARLRRHRLRSARTRLATRSREPWRTNIRRRNANCRAARQIADLVNSATPLIERFDLDAVEREIAAFEHRIDQALIPIRCRIGLSK